MYLNIRVDNFDILTKERKEHPPQRYDASSAKAAPGEAVRDEKGEAHPEKATPNGGPHLGLGRLWLKTWSKSAIAGTTWHTHLYVHTREAPHAAG